jgi:hypothetical protein
MTTSQAIEHLIDVTGEALTLGIDLSDRELAKPLQEAFDQVIEALKQEVQE